MLVENLVAPFFATNCWVIATGKGSECIVVDPGIAIPDFTFEINEALAKYKLKPVAALLTHGHLDHTFSVYPLSKSAESMVAYIHSEDRILLKKPELAMSAESNQMVSMLMSESGITAFNEPDDVQELKSGQEISVAGLSITAIHAPGHTRGSMMFMVNSEVLLSGDVLFAGSIGRTDLPTGSMVEMTKTLKEKVMPLPGGLRVLPGHGPETTIEKERARNPYLRELR
jgi:glyoxylase-like metal-dependent hydrolase (beta-lactamase superfamily II)